jgi:hypothetical protein
MNMSHQTFKVSIIIDDSVENFYIKHYVDDFQPIFSKFKNLVFQRNPCVNSPILKIYWIDAENDKILISCEEDFRLYIEQGQGKKVFFSVIRAPTQQDEDDEVAMDAEDSNDRQKSDRRSRKSTRDEEKQKRASKRLAEKMRSAEEKLRTEAERHSRCSDKHERKTAERLERAKKRCDQIRSLIGAFDPANLSCEENAYASTSSNASAIPPAVNNPATDVLNASPEIIRIVSNAILAGCLQPANFINKMLTEIIGMVPVVPTENVAQAAGQASSDQQQQTEFQRQHMATNTSDMNTPTSAADLSNEEIKALFKEAAKELEKMNEIANSNKSQTMETSTMSAGSSNSVVTQIERNCEDLTDSAISNSTVINIDPPGYAEVVAQEDGRGKSPDIEESFKIVTPPKSILRSRESSIEVHDVNSMMSDDSRDWTMLDASTNENEEEVPFLSARAQSPVKQPETPTATPADKSVSTETQTPKSISSGFDSSSLPTPEEVRASIQKSIETVGEMSEMVKNSVASAQQSLLDFQQPEAYVEPPAAQPKPLPVLVLKPIQPTFQLINSERRATSVASQATPVATSVAAQATPVASSVASQATLVTDPVPAPVSTPPVAAARLIWPPTAPQVSANTPANLMANGMGAKPKAPQTGPAVIVYDPNPKINTAVHTMLAMGFSNDGGWLTQLLLNVDGDVPAAINFLTPQPKNKPQ